MGLIFFILAVLVLAFGVAFYVLNKRKAIPPYQAPLNPNWPFPTDKNP